MGRRRDGNPNDALSGVRIEPSTRGSFARISINYVANMWSGTSETIKTLRAQGLLEHELLLRFAIAL